MDIFDAWSDFIETGSVLDYLRYASVRNSKDNFPEYYKDEDELDMQEDDDENLHGRSNNRGTEYW